MSQRVNNLVQLLDTYVSDGGYHLNVNVFNRDTLLDAQAHPEKYPQLTIRVFGYAVKFINLSKEQQDDVIFHTIHKSS
jgi:pyruvate-formate lyase